MKSHLIPAAILTVAGGLMLRFSPWLPAPVRDGAGGAAYVILMVLLVRLAGASAPWAVASGFLWTCWVEALQAWPALDPLRRTLPGRLVLGTTFQWTDFPPYLAGAALAWPILRWLEGSAPAPAAHSTRR